MSESSRKTLGERVKGKTDGQARTHSDVSLVRDNLRSYRGRLRWLFALSGFMLICFAMILVPLSLYIQGAYLGDVRDCDNARVFLNAALGMCTILVQLGIIFKLYASAIDLEIWFYSIAGSQPPTNVTMKSRILKLGAMGFIALGMIFVIWGMLAPVDPAAAVHATFIVGHEQHSVDMARQALAEKAHKLTVLSLLMAILSLLYFIEIKRDELRVRSLAD